MIQYTTDKKGCMVFEKNTDIKKLGLDNCFVIDDKALYVIPFDKLGEYVSHFCIDKAQNRWSYYRNEFNQYLKDKKFYFILNGTIHKQPYHHSCQNKMNYITNTNVYGDRCYNCKYTPLPNAIFQWNKSLCKYIKPIYCDIDYTNRRKSFFPYLNPSIETQAKNKETLTLRGQQASKTKQLKKTKCLNCIYIKTCKEKKKREQNCCITRKMLNRRMRQLAKKHFGSFDKLVEMMSYCECESKKRDYNTPTESPYPVIPQNCSNIIFDEGYYTRHKSKPYKDVEKHYPKKPITPDLEYKAKIYMFFRCNLRNKNRWGKENDMYDNNFNGHIYNLGQKPTNRTYSCIYEYKFKSYLDVMKYFGLLGQLEVEKKLGEL